MNKEWELTCHHILHEAGLVHLQPGGSLSAWNTELIRCIPLVWHTIVCNSAIPSSALVHSSWAGPVSGMSLQLRQSGALYRGNTLEILAELMNEYWMTKKEISPWKRFLGKRQSHLKTGFHTGKNILQILVIKYPVSAKGQNKKK